MALSLDGKIGKDSEHFPDWTEKADKALFVKETKAAGVIIMGANTYKTIGKPLPGRKNIVLTRNQTLTSDDPDLVYTSDSPQAILQNLESEGYSQVILAGGAQINTLFAQAGLIDEVLLTFSPVLIGEGIGLFSEDVDLSLELQHLERLGENSIQARYKVVK